MCATRMTQLLLAATLLFQAFTGRADAQEGPNPPDCSVPSVKGANIDCAALARVDMAASEMVASGYTPGLSVVITRGGRVLFARGYGKANIEAELAATPLSVFPIWSITKVFTAAAIFQLRDAGKLSIDDKLSKYFPSFPRASEVTLRQMLSHTSGLHDYEGENRIPITPDSLIHRLATQPTPYDFSPGTKWSYSNSNYVLLARIVELISGRSWRLYIRDSIVSKVPFIQTAVDQQTDIVPGRALGYLRTTIPGRFANGPLYDPTAYFGTGAMRSNALDLAAWFDAFFSGKVLSPATVKEMTTAARLNDGQLTGGDWGAWGLGIEVGQCGGHRFLGHGGATAFGNAVARWYPDEDYSLVILANTSHTAMRLEERVLRAIVGADKFVGTCN